MYFTEEAICFSDSFIRDIKLGNLLQSRTLLISTCFTPIMIPENGYCSSFKAEETQVHRRMKLIFPTHMNSVTLRRRFATRCESASRSKAFLPCTQHCSVDIGLSFSVVHSRSPVGFFIKSINFHLYVCIQNEDDSSQAWLLRAHPIHLPPDKQTAKRRQIPSTFTPGYYAPQVMNERHE